MADKQKIDLSIVILNYNAGVFLKKAIESIFATVKRLNYEIIVPDNNSTDNSLDLLKEFSNKIRIIKNGKNLGFSGGNNVGAKLAKGKFVLFLNPDTIVYQKTIKAVYDFLEKTEEAGAATCKLRLADGRLDEACHRGFPTPWRALCHFSGLGKIFPKSKFFAGYTLGHLLSSRAAHEIDAGTGAFLMIKKDLGQKLGWWDEDYFWYGEDLDLCYRLKQAGKKVYFLPQVKALHYRGISSGIKKHSQGMSQAKKETKIKAARASIVAMRIFYQKHYARKYPSLLRTFVFTGIRILELFRLLKVTLSR